MKGQHASTYQLLPHKTMRVLQANAQEWRRGYCLQGVLKDCTQKHKVPNICAPIYLISPKISIHLGFVLGRVTFFAVAQYVPHLFEITFFLMMDEVFYFLNNYFKIQKVHRYKLPISVNYLYPLLPEEMGEALRREAFLTSLPALPLLPLLP